MSEIGDPSNRYNVLSNWGRLAGNKLPREYVIEILSEYDGLLRVMKEKLKNNKNKGAEEKERYP